MAWALNEADVVHLKVRMAWALNEADVVHLKVRMAWALAACCSSRWGSEWTWSTQRNTDPHIRAPQPG